MDQSTYSSSDKLTLENIREKADSPAFKITLIAAALVLWTVLCIQSELAAKPQIIAAGVIVSCLMTLRAISGPIKTAEADSK